jgi:hypothetical protein
MIDHKLKSIAYHEAGHAVIARLNRIRIISLSIIPDDTSLGRMNQHSLWHETSPSYDSTTRSRWRMERQVKTLFAGCIAEAIYEKQNNLERQNPNTDESDNIAAMNLVSHFCGTDEEVEAYMSLLHIQAKNELKDKDTWRAVGQLADHLYEKKVMPVKKVNEWFRENFET